MNLQINNRVTKKIIKESARFWLLGGFLIRRENEQANDTQ